MREYGGVGSVAASTVLGSTIGEVVLKDQSGGVMTEVHGMPTATLEEWAPPRVPFDPWTIDAATGGVDCRSQRGGDEDGRAGRNCDSGDHPRIKSRFRRMKAYSDTIEYGAKQAPAMIRNSHYEMLDNAMEHTAKTMEKLPIVGGAVADTFRATLAPVRAFHDMMEAAIVRGKELEKYNGNLAATNARAEVRGMQGDLREAQVTGANLARITDAQSRFDDTLREMLLPIKNILYGAIAHDMEMIADYGEQTMGYLKEVIAQLMITTEINEARRRVEERFSGGGAIDALPIDSLRQMLMTKLTGGGAPGGGRVSIQ